MSREAEKAGLWARCITTSAALAVLGAASFGRLHEAIAVPAMPEGLFRTGTYVEIVEPEPVPETRDRTPDRIEHVVEKSDFTVPERPAPAPLPTEPEPQPEPVPAPKPTPKPDPKPKPVPKPAPKKPAAKPAPQRTKPQAAKSPDALPARTAQAAAQGARGESASGGFAQGVNGTASSASAGEANLAVAELVAVVEAHKRYPRRARQTGIEGTVSLRVKIDENGVVSEVQAEDGGASVILKRAALAAAKPLIGMKTRLSRKITVDIPVKFELQ